MRAGVDVDVVNEACETPLYVAAWNGNELVVELLLRARADQDIARYNGITPLYGAVMKGHVQVVQLLLNAGADARLWYHGRKLLAIAERNNDFYMIKLLSNAGCK